MDRQKLWEEFANSGTIKDYLKYSQFSNSLAEDHKLNHDLSFDYSGGINTTERNGHIGDSNYSGNSFKRDQGQ